MTIRIAWLLIIGILCLSHTGSSYRLRAPDNYTAFSGEVHVHYWIPQNSSVTGAVIQLWSVDRKAAVTTVSVPTEFGEGQLTISCGVVDQAGGYVFRMLHAEGGAMLTESRLMAVTWPSVQLKLPSVHAALSKEVSMQLSANVLCDSPRQTFTLSLLVVPEDDVTPENVYTQTLPGLKGMQNAELTFKCSLFDLNAQYYVELHAADDNIVATSNTMRVHHSGAYDLRPKSVSALPCSVALTVSFSQPSCAGSSDVVRLFKQIRTAADSAASPRQLVYVAEKRAVATSNVVRFDCRHFHELVDRYCFVYVSIAVSGTIREEKRVCIPTLNLAVVDGGWTKWSEWGQCSASCGQGVSRRFRACDNPQPANGGKFCEGNNTQLKRCGSPCTEVSTPTPYTADPTCECGCQLTPLDGAADGGKIVTSTRRCRGSNTWQILAPERHVIRLKFTAFTLNVNSAETWVKVRDGGSRMDDLLVRASGGEAPAVVTTTGRQMLVEFMAPYEAEDFYGGHREGFVAIYTVFASNGTGLLDGSGTGHRKAWQTWMILTGLLLGILVMALVIAVVCQCRLHARHANKPPHEGLLNGPRSPDHGSANVTFDLPAETPTKRDYILSANHQVMSSPYMAVRSVDSSNRLYSALPTSPSHMSDKRQHRQRQHEGPDSPVKSPSKSCESSTGNRHDPRNLSFMNAVGGKKSHSGEIAMKLYSGKHAGNKSMMADTQLNSPNAEPRPPVEGRDSLTRRSEEVSRPLHQRDPRPASGVSAGSPTKVSNGTSVPYGQSFADQRPCVKPLVLRHVDRPDGQSPPDATGATTPSSYISELSGCAQKLFPDSKSPSLVLDAELEYDDYIAEIPGSYFDMDPHAYTLTWSKGPAGSTCLPGGTTATSDNASVNTGASHC